MPKDQRKADTVPNDVADEVLDHKAQVLVALLLAPDVRVALDPFLARYTLPRPFDRPIAQ